jgi:cation diffusion facilitator family transporter
VLVAVSSKTRTSIWVAILVDIVIAAVKFGVAFLSRSSSMLSEAVHSLVDTGNGIFLYVGSRRSARPADAAHPFGHGKELYFWTLIAALSIFAAGGGVSIYEGIQHMRNPHSIENPFWTYVVLGVSAVLETVSGWSAYREYRRDRRTEVGIWASFRASRDPTTFTVLFEQIAALAGIIFALVGITLSRWLHEPAFDGLGSIAIGLVLCLVALFLIRESEGLLIGEGISPPVLAEIRGIAAGNPRVEEVLKVLSMVIGPHETFLAMDVKFRAGLTTTQIVQAIDELERDIRLKFVDVTRIFIEAESISPRRSAAG